MSEKKPQPETSRQYGVTYPDGRTFWIVGDNGATGLPGVFAASSLASAQDRGKFIDQWRQNIAGAGIDPDTVPRPTFVTREIVRSFGDSSEVTD